MKKKTKICLFFPFRLYLLLEKFRGFVFDFEGSNLDGVAQRNKGLELSQQHILLYIRVYGVDV